MTSSHFPSKRNSPAPALQPSTLVAAARIRNPSSRTGEAAVRAFAPAQQRLRKSSALVTFRRDHFNLDEELRGHKLLHHDKRRCRIHIALRYFRNAARYAFDRVAVTM